MGWKNLAKVATEWADAKRTELLTTDHRTREDAALRADAASREAEREAGTSAAEAVLPEHLARRVTAQRPENVAARAEAARLDRLAGQRTARVEVTVSGDEHGVAEAALPVEVVVDEADPDVPGSTAWLRVVAEAPHAVPMGTGLGSVSLAVPAYTGPGSYDLRELHALGTAGVIESWDPLDTWVAPEVEVGETAWFWDSSAPGRVDVADDGVGFDLAMVSAVNRVRVTGRISWT